MSSLGPKTKKVNVYGRKKAAIINIHQDVVSPVKASDLVVEGTPVPITPWKRPPLTSKLSQNTVTPLDSSSEEDEHPIKVKGKPKATALKTTKPAKPAKLVIPDSPSVYAPTPARSVIDCIEIPSQRVQARAPRPRRKAVRPPIREDDDLDELTLRLEKTSIGAGAKASAASRTSKRETDLCALCGHNEVQSWSLFLSGVGGKLSKIGEASYSEVFSIEREGQAATVMKVIPLVGLAKDAPEGKAPDCSTMEEVMREIEITKRIADVRGGGFVKFLQASVLEGEYPQELLHEWDEYKLDNGTYSIRPDCFTPKQKYCVVELVNHGLDLENFLFTTSSAWTQALSVLCQVADALARAESFTHFEHRDLHESQILLSAIPKLANENRAKPAYSGIEATIIDFGLSRLDIPGKKAVWSDLPEEVFEGKGEQWDVYRKMRDLTKDDWKGEHLITNVLWLQYLVNYLFSRSDLRKPKTTSKKTSADAKANEESFAILCQMRDALDRAVEVATTTAAGKEVRARRGKEEFSFENAQEVVDWFKQMGWVA